MSAQMRQYPLLNFTMAKSACAGAVAVRPSASAPIAKRNFFIAHSPLCDALLPPLSCCAVQKDFGNRTREPVTAQMVGWVNVTRRKNQPLQIWRLKKRRGKAALIWPCRRVRMFPLHSYPLSPARAGLSFFAPFVGPPTRAKSVSSVRAPAGIRKRPIRRKIKGLPAFTTVKGGAYFFLPSLKALHYLVTLSGEDHWISAVSPPEIEPINRARSKKEPRRTGQRLMQ